MLSLSQERAERTRHRLVQAAATEFSCHGYQGTSLVRISKAAGVTMGALTFHFPAKVDLADAVYADATTAARAAVEHAHASGEAPLQTVVNITHALSRLLREQDTVRAAVRLGRENRPTKADLSDLWMPRVRGLLHQAHADKELHPHATPDVVLGLVGALIAAFELLDCPHQVEGSNGPPLSDVWNLLMPAVSAGGHTVHPYSTTP